MNRLHALGQRKGFGRCVALITAMGLWGCTFDSTLPDHLRNHRDDGGGDVALDLPIDQRDDRVEDPVDLIDRSEDQLDEDVSPGVDSDGDGLSDDHENRIGTNPYDADSDDDGLSDYREVMETGTDPLDSDTDGDGFDDGADGCPFDPAKIVAGLCGCGVSDSDGDLDTVPDCLDVCPGGNDQLDTDGDGVPNLCDFCNSPVDSDVDGVPDDCDACPGWDDDDDLDGDRQPDRCDPCPRDNPNDSDGDRVCDSDDVCPGGDDRVDTDGDGIPNACDSDDDNDGVPDVDDGSVLNPAICQDTDRDGCDDCSTGVDGLGPASDYNPAADGLDTDGDVLCNLGDPDDDNDGVLDGADPAPVDPDICGDTDGDGCEDCSIGTDDFGPRPDGRPDEDGPDADGDGVCDVSDTCDDVDGDGLGTGSGASAGCLDPTVDSDDDDPTVCADTDGDSCDDCQYGGFDPLADGPDTDEDGLCDEGDDCSDRDGDGLGTGARRNSGCLDPATDTDDNNATLCADTDEDLCDDCSAGEFDPAGDGEDRDSDGICDLGDNCPLVYNPGQQDGDRTGIYADGEPLAAVPVISWRDFTRVSLGDDDLSPAIPIGFDFEYFGETRRQAYICSNGFITFDGGAPCDFDPTARSLPYEAEPNDVIAVFWEDLDPSEDGWVGYRTVGAEGSRQFIVAFNGVPHWYSYSSGQQGSYPVTATIALDEATGAIDLVCYDCPSNSDGRLRGEHTQGVENADGTLGWAPPDRNNAVFGPLLDDGVRIWTDRPSVGADGVGDVCDNCPAVSNPEQQDTRATALYAWAAPVPFEMRDMIGATEVGLGDEQLSAAIPIGFTFEFYGQSFENVHICSNGFLSFDGSATCASTSSRLLPNSQSPNNLIALYWEDLDPSHSSSEAILYRTLGERPNREFVVMFDRIRHWNALASVTGQIVLHETTGDIDLVCQSCRLDCVATSVNSCPHTQGIEDGTGTLYRAMTRRNHVSVDLVEDAVRFHPGNLGDACDLDG